LFFFFFFLLKFQDLLFLSGLDLINTN